MPDLQRSGIAERQHEDAMNELARTYLLTSDDFSAAAPYAEADDEPANSGQHWVHNCLLADERLDLRLTWSFLD